MYVPDSNNLRNQLIEQYHGSGHLGTDKVYNSCVDSFYWPNMYKSVSKFVQSCHECQVNKSENKSQPGLLQPLKTPPYTWHTIATDFLTELPKTKAGFDCILVIVYKLSKRAIFEPFQNTATSKDVYQIFQNHLFTQHGIPAIIISDKDHKFRSNYWRGLTEILSIKLNLSTTDHPQTDGQSENLIKTLSFMLRNCIQKTPESWDIALSQFEFEYNSSKHTSTKLSPFEIDLGRNPNSQITRSIEDCTIQCQASFDTIERKRAFSNIAKDNLLIAQSTQKFYADKNRRDKSYKKRDWVLLKTEAIHGRAQGPTVSNKWRTKFLGHLEILEVMGPVTYKLELPSSMKSAHFHVSKLKPYKKRSDSSRLTTVTIDVHGNEEHAVRAILNKKTVGRRLFYLVHFYGTDDSEAVWMPKSELGNCRDLVAAFERTAMNQRGR